VYISFLNYFSDFRLPFKTIFHYEYLFISSANLFILFNIELKV